MTTPNVRDLLVVPGRLSYGPSDLTTAYPHGGTGLGLVAGIEVTLSPTWREEGDITDEAKGGEVTESIQQAEKITVSGILKSWDNDALNLLFPNTSIPTGAGRSGRRIINFPGSAKSGARMSSRGVVLVFTPDDTDYAPTLIVRRAIPSIRDTFTMNMRLNSHAEMAVVFVGIRDTSGDLCDFGYRKDLTL